nr:unnamed protein product [Naegleria fowleri]
MFKSRSLIPRLRSLQNQQQQTSLIRLGDSSIVLSSSLTSCVNNVREFSLLPCASSDLNVSTKSMRRMIESTTSSSENYIRNYHSSSQSNFNPTSSSSTTNDKENNPNSSSTSQQHVNSANNNNDSSSFSSSSGEEKKSKISPTVRRVGIAWVIFSTLSLMLLGFSVKDILFLDEELMETENESLGVPHNQPFYQYHFKMPHQLESIIKIIRSFVALGIVVADYKLHFNKLDNVEGVTEEEILEHKSAVHRRSAQRLVQLCLANGGVFIKAGQHIASLNQVLPVEFTEGFKPCQDRAPTRPWSVIEAFIREELTGVKRVEKGASDPLYDVYFSRIESKPIAAGSLAQVHVAYLKGSDNKVALKVQYPDLRETLSSDTKLLKRLIAMAEFAFKDIKLQWICNEFELNLPFELNFFNEAKNCYLLGQKLATVPKLRDHVRTPHVYWTHCTDKVLTIEFVDGFKVTDIHSMREKGIDIDVSYISYLLSHAFSEQIFSKAFIHADPHPGNIICCRKRGLWSDNIELVLIDHGLYHQLDNDFRILYCRLWKAIVDYNKEELIEVSKQLGLTDSKNKQDGPLMSELLKVILTARAHDPNEDLYTVHTQGSQQKQQSKNKLLAYSQRHFMDIAKVLGDLDRKVLLLLKCNDLLRSIQMDLGVPVNYFIIFAQYAIKAIHEDRLTRVFEQHRKQGLLMSYFNYCLTYLKCKKEYLIFDAKLKLYLLATSLMGFYQNFKREWAELKFIVETSRNARTSTTHTFYKLDPSHDLSILQNPFAHALIVSQYEAHHH